MDMSETTDSIKQLIEPVLVNTTGVCVVGLTLQDTLLIVQILVGVSLITYNTIKVYAYFKKKAK